LAVLRRFLYGEGRTVHLVVRRGDEKRKVPLLLDYAWRRDKSKR
jgi:hypothetical protein